MVQMLGDEPDEPNCAKPPSANDFMHLITLRLTWLAAKQIRLAQEAGFGPVDEFVTQHRSSQLGETNLVDNKGKIVIQRQFVSRILDQPRVVITAHVRSVTTAFSKYRPSYKLVLGGTL